MITGGQALKRQNEESLMLGWAKETLRNEQEEQHHMQTSVRGVEHHTQILKGANRKQVRAVVNFRMKGEEWPWTK